MSWQREIFINGARRFGPVCRHAADENKLLNIPAVTIALSDRLHHAGCSSDIDLPHPLLVENAGLKRVDNEGEVDDGVYLFFTHQRDQFVAGRFFTQIEGLESRETLE